MACRLARRQTTLVFELGFIVALFMGFPGYVLHWRSDVNLGTSVRMYDWQKKIPYIGPLTQLVYRCAPVAPSHSKTNLATVWGSFPLHVPRLCNDAPSSAAAAPTTRLTRRSVVVWFAH